MSGLVKLVEQIFADGGVPPTWSPPLGSIGTLHVVIPPRRAWDVQIPADGCSLYSPEMKNMRSYKSLPVLAEGMVNALILRHRELPKGVAMALMTDPATSAFVRTRPEMVGVWDHVVNFDVDRATRALDQAGMPMPTRMAIRNGLWKLAGMLMSPFERTLCLDSDVSILSDKYVVDLLQNGLRLYEMAMPVDIGRPGNLDPGMASRRKNQRGWFKARESGTGEDIRARQTSAALKPPMFAHGFPPVCTGIVAFARGDAVRHLLQHAAVRLINQTNLIDPTATASTRNNTRNITYVRQTEQEMIWFELAHGPVEKQPRVLILPEEYYCPAVPGSLQAIDYLTALGAGAYPIWSVDGSTNHLGDSRRGTFVTIPNDRYLAGGAKDCHAVHMHLTLRGLTRFNVTAMMSTHRAEAQMHFALFWQDQELFCWQRAYYGIQPRCYIGEKKMVFAENASGTTGRRLASRRRRRKAKENATTAAARRSAADFPDCGVYNDSGCVLRNAKKGRNGRNPANVPFC